jgi:hypothetical protein
MMVRPSPCTCLDEHRPGPKLLRADARADRCLAQHAGRLWRVGIQFIGVDDTNAIELPVRLGHVHG